LIGDVLLLAASFAVILTGALVFTNAVEWLGRRLAIGEGAVGSLLAAVGTAMPESLIPLVAVVGGGSEANSVAIGAIVGAPFLLATLAMALVGVAAVAFTKRRTQERALNIHAPTVRRDLMVFLGFFAAALVLGLAAPRAVQIGSAVAFVAGYAVYVRRTLKHGGEVQAEETLAPLTFNRQGDADPSVGLIVLQFAVGLLAIAGGAHLFVEEATAVAEEIGVEVLVLSLVLAPLATELPEKINSFFWIRDGKDTLALGNITGAMVFQSTIPVAFGLAFTDWDLDRFAVLSMSLGLAGGAVALISLLVRRRFDAAAILTWAGLYATFILYVILTA
jgi:cation:H+ antiporter